MRKSVRQSVNWHILRQKVNAFAYVQIAESLEDELGLGSFNEYFSTGVIAADTGVCHYSFFGR